MYRLELEKTGSTPYILIDEEKGYMHCQGECFHENVTEFFQDITGWLKSFLESDFEQFVFDCELKYFNSSTAKLLLNMFLMMENAAKNGKNVTVNWIAAADSEINIECGEDFAAEVRELNFHIVLHD